MLKRAYQLRIAIDHYITANTKYDLSSLVMTPAEWRQVAYLRELLREFAIYTVSLSEHTGTTIHRVYDIYDSLFNHIEDYLTRLLNKQFRWKKILYKGLEAAQDKLRKYYQDTYEFHGDMYAIATILNPCSKLEGFRGASWSNDRGRNYTRRYKEKLTEVYTYYATQFPLLVQTSVLEEPTGLLEKALHDSKRRRLSPEETAPSGRYLELRTYLAESKYSHLLQYWILDIIILTMVKLYRS